MIFDEPKEPYLQGDTISLERQGISRSKMNTKRLQISINNENQDSHNIGDELIL